MSIIHTDEFRTQLRKVLLEVVRLLLTLLQRVLEDLQDRIVENDSSKYD